ncbi:MAG: hemin uptake protein HemP [Nitrosomonas sp.]|nr:hemin uptake protein HemP [Nitrosomonas sp.]MDP1950806.1 hemin uptake protein HemP [Nitrosomonas sp.]
MNNSTVTSANPINSHRLVVLGQNTPIDSNTLFAHGDVVFIQHQGEQYLLRRTRNGKLILTK